MCTVLECRVVVASRALLFCSNCCVRVSRSPSTVPRQHTHGTIVGSISRFSMALLYY
jgi:hypothetical protein